jgi:ribosomal RNA-processing protein 12
VRIFHSGLGFRYAHAHDLILLVNAALLERLGDAAQYLMRDVVVDLGELWDTAPSSIREELTLTIGQAVAAMGPVAFLDAVPMNLEKMLVDGSSPQDKTIRDWLLPLLRDHVRGTRLADFGQHFLTLAQRIAARAAELEAAGKRAIEAKTLRIIYTQIWAVFPAFCVYPRDVAETFPKLARIVGAAIATEPLVRQYATQGLQTIIDNLIHAASADEDSQPGPEAQAAGIPTADQARAQLAVVAPFAKNFLPVLLNAFRAMAGDGTGTHREYVLRCVTSYARIAGSELTNDVFRSAVRKLLEATAAASGGPEENRLRCDMVDIALSVADLLDDESAGLLLRVALPQALGADPALQKRSYNVLARLCAREGFLEVHGGELANALVAGNANVGGGGAGNSGDDDEDDSGDDDDDSDSGMAKEEDKSKKQKRSRGGKNSTEALLSGTPSAMISTAAKRPRLRVLRHLVARLDPATSARVFVAAVLPEVVLCTRESNSEARAEAFDLLVAFGHRLSGGSVTLSTHADDEHTNNNNSEQHQGRGSGTGHHQGKGWAPAPAPPSDIGGLHHYITLLIATLAARSPRMLSASVTAISRVLYEFAQFIPDLADEMLKTILELGSHNSREVGGALLAFLKVALSALPVERTRPYLKQFVTTSLRWSQDSKALKSRGRTVVERLVRRFGAEEVGGAMPEGDMRLLQYIRRMNDRHERNKRGGKDKGANNGAGGAGKDAAGGAGKDGEHRPRGRAGFEALLADSDDEDTNAYGGSGGGGGGGAAVAPGGKRRRGGDDGYGSYLKEGAAGGVVDMLDSRQMMASVSTVRPGSRAAERDAASLRRAKDGRLVVPEDPDDNSTAKRRRVDPENLGDEDNEALMTADDRHRRDEAEAQAVMDLDTAGENVRGAARRGRAGMALKLKSDGAASSSTTWASALERKVRQGTAAGGAAAAGPPGARPGTKRAAARAEGYGSSYKPRRPGTGGDMKVKNKPDPYAFVPLGAPAKRAGPLGKVRDKGLAKLVSGKAQLGQQTRAKRVAAKRKGGKK